MMVAIGNTVPELAVQLDVQQTFEEAARTAVGYFGDQGHPLPEHLVSYGRRISDGRLLASELPPGARGTSGFQPLPPLERLPPLDDDGELAVSKDTGGRPEVEISQDTLFEIFRQSLQRGPSRRSKPTYEEIAANNGVERTWVTPIVKWAVKHPREAREAIRLSKTPPRFSTFVRD
jgi:hypothetical protein